MRAEAFLPIKYVICIVEHTQVSLLARENVCTRQDIKNVMLLHMVITL